MPEYVSQSEFARRVGVSQPRVSKLIKQGALKGAVKRDGRRCLIHFQKALDLWDKNRAPENRPENRSGKARKGKRRQVTPDEKRAEAAKAGTGGLDYHAARTLHEQYKAALAKLKYEKEKGLLIPADQARDVWVKHISAAKVKLLGIKARCAPFVLEILDSDNAHRLLEMIHAEVVEALTELAREGNA